MPPKGGGRRFRIPNIDFEVSFTLHPCQTTEFICCESNSLTGFTNALYHPDLHFAAQDSVPRRSRKEALDVIKLDIINRVADKTGVPKMKAEQAVEALFHSMKEALTRGERIELRGFGVFVVKPRKRGVGRNPRTGEEVAIPSGKTIRFKPGKELQSHEDDENNEEF